MNFYIASGFQNKHLVRSVANELKHAGWHHTYDWTKNEKAANEEQLREIGQAEQNAVKEADVLSSLEDLLRFCIILAVVLILIVVIVK